MQVRKKQAEEIRAAKEAKERVNAEAFADAQTWIVGSLLCKLASNICSNPLLQQSYTLLLVNTSQPHTSVQMGSQYATGGIEDAWSSLLVLPCSCWIHLPDLLPSMLPVVFKHVSINFKLYWHEILYCRLPSLYPLVSYK